MPERPGLLLRHGALPWERGVQGDKRERRARERSLLVARRRPLPPTRAALLRSLTLATRLPCLAPLSPCSLCCACTNRLPACSASSACPDTDKVREEMAATVRELTSYVGAGLTQQPEAGVAARARCLGRYAASLFPPPPPLSSHPHHPPVHAHNPSDPEDSWVPMVNKRGVVLHAKRIKDSSLVCVRSVVTIDAPLEKVRSPLCYNARPGCRALGPTPSHQRS